MVPNKLDELQFAEHLSVPKLLLNFRKSVYLTRLDDIEESLKYYEKALQACPSLLPAYRGVQSIYNKQVERWHFRMLNDVKRNEAYCKAIACRIKEGFTSILDVGTGTGLLRYCVNTFYYP